MKNNVNEALVAMCDGFLTESKELKVKLGANQLRVGELKYYLEKQLSADDDDEVIFSPHLIDKKQLDALMYEERNREKDILEAENQMLQKMLDTLNEQIGVIREVISIDPFINRFRFLDMQEKERQRIARDLHDSSLQNLTHLIHSIELCSLYIDKDAQQARLELQSITQHIREVIEEMRTTIYNLRPMEFDDLGFCESIRNMVDKMQKNSSIFIELDMSEDIKVKNDLIYSNIYRIVRECISNAIKHSNASKLHIKLRDEDNMFRVDIEDDGIGFDENKLYIDEKHFGLQMVDERVQLLKGSSQILSRGYGKDGTVIKIEIPTLA